MKGGMAQCPKCQKVVTKAGLYNHDKRYHGGEDGGKRFVKCGDCGSETGLANIAAHRGNKKCLKRQREAEQYRSRFATLSMKDKEEIPAVVLPTQGKNRNRDTNAEQHPVRVMELLGLKEKEEAAQANSGFLPRQIAKAKPRP